MTRQEIEGYLLHAKASPETFVLDEQADLLEADIAAAVAKALAEQRAEWISTLKAASGEYTCHPDFAEMWAKAEVDPTYWAELLSSSRDAYHKQDARHAREIERARLEAKIEALDDLWCATKRYERGRTEECAWMVGVTPYSVRMDVETLAAALAALEVKGE